MSPKLVAQRDQPSGSAKTTQGLSMAKNHALRSKSRQEIFQIVIVLPLLNLTGIIPSKISNLLDLLIFLRSLMQGSEGTIKSLTRGNINLWTIDERCKCCGTDWLQYRSQSVTTGKIFGNCSNQARIILSRKLARHTRDLQTTGQWKERWSD